MMTKCRVSGVTHRIHLQGLMWEILVVPNGRHPCATGFESRLLII